MWRFIVLVIGIGLCADGVTESRLYGVVDVEPQRLTCAQLAESGPGDNAHVILTDFELTDDFVVSEKEQYKVKTWEEAWVPAIPVEGAPQAIRVIVWLPDATSERDVAEAAGREELQGLVVNEIQELGASTRRILASSYEGVDFDKCWILAVGRRPPRMLYIMGVFTGGLLAIAIAIRAFMKRPAPRDRKRRPLREPPDAAA